MRATKFVIIASGKENQIPEVAMVSSTFGVAFEHREARVAIMRRSSLSCLPSGATMEKKRPPEGG
jgi:hypothetical protein